MTPTLSGRPRTGRVTGREASGTGCGRIPRDRDARQRGNGHRDGEGIRPGPGRRLTRARPRDRACHLHVANFPYLFKSGPTARAAARGRDGRRDPRRPTARRTRRPPHPRRRPPKRAQPARRSAHAVNATYRPQHQPSGPTHPGHPTPATPGATASRTGRTGHEAHGRTDGPGRRRPDSAPPCSDRTQTLRRSDASQKPPNARGHTLGVVGLREPGPPDRTMITATSTGSRPSPMVRLRQTLTPGPHRENPGSYRRPSKWRRGTHDRIRSLTKSTSQSPRSRLGVAAQDTDVTRTRRRIAHGNHARQDDTRHME